MDEQQAAKKLAIFFSKFRSLEFKKGETILGADENPQGVLYLKKGYVRLYTLSPNAEELTLIIFKPEDFFPLTWAINYIPNTYYLEAMTAVELYLVPREQFLKFLKNNCDALFVVTSDILARLSGVLNRMEHAIFGNAQTKVASIILICSERFGVKKGQDIIIQLPLTHHDIANLLGMARETVSIEMEKLQNRQIINHQGRTLIVKNIKELKIASELKLHD